MIILWLFMAAWIGVLCWLLSMILPWWGVVWFAVFSVIMGFFVMADDGPSVPEKPVPHTHWWL